MSRDERLARRAANGDRRAFAEIYKRYHQDLYRFCLAMVGNSADAQDALQNTMVKVLRALPGEKREIKLKPWLYRIARNESVETLRRRRDSAELHPELPGEAGIAERMETRERLRTLLGDLDQLPERQRAALVMRELSGLDFDQIAATFGSSPAVARQTLYEARLGLRQLEEGREMSCAEVMKALSDADGRVTRRRDIRAHLRNCPDCRAFREEIAGRRENLAAIAPLPVAASAGLLHSLLGAKASGAMGGGVAGAVGAGAGKVAATSAIVKSAVAVAVVAAVGAGAADRAHLISLPFDGSSGGAAEQSAAHGATPGDGARHGAAGDHGRAGARNGPAKPRSAHEGKGSPGASTGSHSENGVAPPGGGFGRSASERHGRPESTPPAAHHGQQTAAAHKPAQATHSPPRRSGGSPPGSAPPHSKAPPSPTPPAATPVQPPPPSAPEAQEPPAGPESPPEHPEGNETGHPSSPGATEG